MGFSDGSAGKEPACTAGDLDSIPGLGRSPGEGKGYPLQYSSLENSMDCIVHVVAKSQTQQWLSLYIYIYIYSVCVLFVVVSLISSQYPVTGEPPSYSGSSQLTVMEFRVTLLTVGLSGAPGTAVTKITVIYKKLWKTKTIMTLNVNYVILTEEVSRCFRFAVKRLPNAIFILGHDSEYIVMAF